MPECILQRFQLVEQSDWIQRVVNRVQSTLPYDVQHTTGQDALKRSLCGSVHPSYTTTRPRLGAQFHRRLKEVHIQPHGPIQLGQLAIGALTFEAVVTDQLPNDRAIFLLDLCRFRDYADEAGFGKLWPRRWSA
jgi:hypothetical protein